MKEYTVSSLIHREEEGEHHVKSMLHNLGYEYAKKHAARIERHVYRYKDERPNLPSSRELYYDKWGADKMEPSCLLEYFGTEVRFILNG